jgi:hypothetical protein
VKQVGAGDRPHSGYNRPYLNEGRVTVPEKRVMAPKGAAL